MIGNARHLRHAVIGLEFLHAQAKRRGHLWNAFGQNAGDFVAFDPADGFVGDPADRIAHLARVMASFSLATASFLPKT